MSNLQGDQLNQLVAAANRSVSKDFPDLLAKSNYLLKKIVENKEKVTGGREIQFPVQIADNKSQGFFDGRQEQHDTNQNQVLSFGRIPWCYFYSTVTVTLEEIVVTEESDAAILNLVKEKISIAEKSIPKEFNRVLYQSNATKPKQFNGLKDMISTSAYAGLPPDPNGDGGNIWLPEIDATSPNYPTFANISKMIGLLKERADGPKTLSNGVDMLVSRESLISTFMEAGQLQQQFVQSDKLHAGFEHTMIRGIPWFSDKDCPGTANASDFYLYLLASDTINLFYKYGFDGKASPMNAKGLQTPNQSVETDVLYTVGNFGCKNRQLNGVFTGMKEALA